MIRCEVRCVLKMRRQLSCVLSLPKFLNALILSQDVADEPSQNNDFFRNLGDLGIIFRGFRPFCIYRSIASIHFF